MVRTRRGQTPPLANPNNTNNMTPEAVQTMIDQALLRNSGGGDGNHRSEYQQKDRKPSQNDKTEHGMEKTVQNQGQSP
ncbi:hypothetical protein Tco_0873906 [Tanacetum coccineum]|uniref:Uncharacterized protein n=1 Tax=Tanacetum coccineum TaxID=301880 RepID=A0ABQ5BK70_9ASTR